MVSGHWTTTAVSILAFGQLGRTGGSCSASLAEQVRDVRPVWPNKWSSFGQLGRTRLFCLAKLAEHAVVLFLLPFRLGCLVN